MNTSWKFFVLAVCMLGMVAVLGIMAPRSHRTHDDVNSSVRIAPRRVEAVQVERGHNSRSMHSSNRAVLEQPAADADSESADSLEDPDQIRAWARSNPQRAREWLAGAPEGAKRDTVSEMVWLYIAETNAAEAVALADRYGPGGANVLENLMAQWADQDIQAAYEWAAAKPPGKQRDGLLSRIAFVESKSDPKDAATVVAEEIPPGPIQDEAAISVLYQWALNDPEAALTWAQSFSAGNLHDRAVKEVQNVIASRPQTKKVF